MNARATACKSPLERLFRIAFVTQPWDRIMPSRGGCDGSTAILTQEMARRLAARGHHVCVYGAGQRFDTRERIEHAEGVDFHTLPAVSLELKLFNLYQRAADRLAGPRQANRPRYASRLYLAAYGRQLARAINEAGCDIVHVHNLFQLVPAIRARNPSVRIILHMHCEWLSQIAPDVIANYLADADMVIGVSEHITRKVRARFPAQAQRCKTVHNGVDIEAFTARPGSRSGDGQQRLLFVGRVSPEKGVHLLIDAFARVHRAYPDAVLDIVGPPAQVAFNFLVGLDENEHVAELASFYEAGKPTYFEQVKARMPPELAGRVKFLGLVPYSQIAARYRAADVFVNATYSDAFSMPTAEAMAHSLPVVATRVGGVKEIVLHEKTGLLSGAGDAGMLAEGIVRLLGDGALRKSMGQAGRRRITQSFSWKHTVDQLEAQYREMLQ